MTDQERLSEKRSRYTFKIRICPCRRAEGVGLLQAAQHVCLSVSQTPLPPLGSLLSIPLCIHWLSLRQGGNNLVKP